MIKFNQPRYILPLIILPFIYIFFYMFQYFFGKEEKTMAVQETTSINPELPDPFLDEGDLKGKFDAFLDAHKNNRNFSAIQEIDRREDKSLEAKMSATNVAPAPTPVEKRSVPAIDRQVNQRRSYVPTNSARQEMSDYEKQMRLFRAQMSYTDSLLRGEEVKGITGNGEEGGRHLSAEEEKSEGGSNMVIGHQSIGKENKLPMVVEKKDGIQAVHFNTIIKDKSELLIKAVIDEALKVRKDSRIRLRLLEEVKVGDRVIPKGQYLYGQISSFKPQRVEIHISSILIDGQITEIALDIYDMDGMKGLYVPESRFRELVKEMGGNMTSGQQLNIDAPPDNQMQLMYGLAKDAFNTSTQTTSKAIRKNKAKLKYNTMVYLVNTNKENKASIHQQTL